MTTPEPTGAGSQQTPPHAAVPTGFEGAPASSPLPQPPTAKPKKALNVVGLVALITAGLGFIFACIPGALIVGWILLPVAFILALVSLFLKDRAKWMGLTALIVSIVGTIIGFVVFFAVVATSFDDAFGGDTTVEVQEDAGETAGDEPADEAPAAAEVGTRENPAALGSPVSSDEWTVVVNSVNFDIANDPAFIEANQYFDTTLPEGEQFVGINVTYTYIGDDPEGGMPAFVSTDLVTAGGVTLPYDVIALYGDPSVSTSALYNGGTVTDTLIRTAPTAEIDGLVIAVNPGMLSDTAFVAVR